MTTEPTPCRICGDNRAERWGRNACRTCYVAISRYRDMTPEQLDNTERHARIKLHRVEMARRMQAGPYPTPTA